MPTSEERRGDEGFSLIELMVVVLIVGILIAIALPTFLGARSRAQNRAAQSDLRTGLAAALTSWSQTGIYDGFDATEAETVEPALDWEDQGVDPAAGQITIQLAEGTELLLVGRSQSGTYYCLRQLQNSPAFERGMGDLFAEVNDPTLCTDGWS